MAKTIDKIKYRPAGQDTEVAILVRMEAGLSGATFTCLLEGDSNIKVEGADLNKMLVEIRKKVDEKYAIKWESKLRVTFAGDTNSLKDMEFFFEKGAAGYFPNEQETKLTLTVTPLVVAKNTKGEIIYRTEGGNYISYGDPCSVQLSCRESEVSALIDDTPENRERLMSIFDAFHSLHKRLMQMFSQKSIAQTLQTKNLLGMESKK